MTIAARFREVAKNHHDRPALAYLLGGQYQTINYSQLENFSRQLAHLFAQKKWSQSQKVAVMLPNGPEWIISDLAAASLGLVVVPIHSTYNAEFIIKVIKHAEAKYLIIHADYMDQYGQAIKNLYLDSILIVGAKEDDAKDHGIWLWPELSDRSDAPETKAEIGSGDIHTIIYTSGTTGDPKGVMLSHQNLLSNVDAARRAIDIYPDDRFFSFLPLSHAFERTAGYYVPISAGASIYFAQSSKTIVEDIKKAQPTVLSSVPRIFEKMYGKIFDKVEKGSKNKKKLFFKALQLSALKRKNKLNFTQKIQSKILEALVLKKIRAILGGRLRLVISGGASLDEKIIRFFDDIGLPILEGYGLTETAPIVSVNRIDQYRFGTVGLAIDCNEVKIAEDKEILVRGSNVMQGYYKNPEMTRELIDSEAWLHTGDLGFVDKEGFISIIGRAKDVIVLSTGKNIFPEPIESVLNESRYISQSMVYGDKEKNLSALIVPNFEQLKIWCQKNNVNYDLENKKVLDFYREKIEEKIGHLSAVEKIVNFRLLAEEFSQENGLLTPTLKLRRRVIYSNYN